MVRVLANLRAEERAAIADLTSRILAHSAASGVNLVQYVGRSAPPTQAIIIRYLHSQIPQIDFVSSLLRKQFEKEAAPSPRDAWYLVDPTWVENEDEFRNKYANSQFLDGQLNPTNLDDVIKNPQNKFIVDEELDLVVELTPEDKISEMAQYILSVERDGPAAPAWQTPVVIVRSETELPQIGGFVRKPYFSISDTGLEYYSVLYESESAQQLLRLVAVKHQVLARSCRILNSQINKKFEEYLNTIRAKPFTPFDIS